jgi:glucose/arabinose dehydrogenase
MNRMQRALFLAALTSMACGTDLRADRVHNDVHSFQVETFIEGLEIPWGMAFLPDGRLLVTERRGTLRIADTEGGLSAPLAGVPPVRNQGQGGLLDVALHPGFADNRWVYLAYSHSRGDEGFTVISRGRLGDGGLEGVETLYQAPGQDYSGRGQHYGARIVFDADGYMFFSIGDRGERQEAQDLGTANGKLHRLHDDGRVPADNPFVGRDDTQASIWSYGHRNQQGVAVHPETGRIWTAEHGPRGGDELNLIGRGLNYGWPAISYGINYNGTPITDATHAEGMEQPVYYWTPSLGVCGIEFYDGDAFPRWRNSLFVSSLALQRLHRLQIEGERVVHDEILFETDRVRDIETGPDGYVYVALENPGRIVRFVPVD